MEFLHLQIKTSVELAWKALIWFNPFSFLETGYNQLFILAKSTLSTYREKKNLRDMSSEECPSQDSLHSNKSLTSC